MIGDRSVILVVDDEEMIRSIIGEQLSEIGYKVILANDGDEAFAIMKECLDIDLILTDVRMPGSIDGFDLVERAVSHKPNIRSIVMSGYTDDKLDRIKRADMFISKPFPLSRLAKYVSRLLSCH